MQRTTAVVVLSVLVLAGACGGSKREELPPPAAEPQVDRATLLRQAAARVEAAREQKREQMRALGTVTLKRKKISGPDKQKKAELEFEFENTSDKELVQVEGTMVFRDAEGNPLKQIKVPFRESIAPGKTATKRGKFPLDVVEEGDVKFAKIPLAQLQTEWIPRLYRMADGTELQGE